MPVLVAGGPPPVVGQPPAVIPDDDRVFEFRALDGSDLLSWSDDEWVMSAGVFGVEAAPRIVTRDRLPGRAGTRLVEVADDEADMVLPLWLRPVSRDWRDVIKGLGRVLRFVDYRDRDYVAAEGTFDLVAVSQGEVRTRRVTYLQGLEGDYSNPGGFHLWRVVPLRLLACDPDWHGVQWSTPVVRLPAPWPFLSPVGSLNQPLRITSSVALGADMPVRVTGDVPSPVTVELVGPLTSATVTSPGGLSVVVGSLTSGQVFRLETGRRKRALLDGVSAWGKVAAGPQWRPLPPGAVTISVEVTGATQATTARVFGDSLWQTPWRGAQV